jgi:hypothetical protein
MMFFRAISRVKWLNDEKNQRLVDHLWPRPQGADMDKVKTKVKFSLCFLF